MILLDWLGKAAAWDVAAFRFINSGLYWRPLADAAHWFARDTVLLAMIAIGCLLYGLRAGWRGFLHLAGWGAAAVLGSNLLHNLVLKPFFNRTRPFFTVEDVRLIAPLNDLFTMSLSFPSTHAASATALAVVAGAIDSRLRWVALGFAFCVGLGSIYAGGHYPADVLAGFAVGGLLGWGMVWLRSLFLAAAPRQV